MSHGPTAKPAALRALLTRLDAAEHAAFADGEADRLIATLGGHGWLLRAIEWAFRGCWQRARADVTAALRAAPRDAVLRVVAAAVLFATRDYHESMARLREAGERSRAVGARARQHALAYASRLAWSREQAAALRELARLVPGRVMWHEQAAALHRLGHSDAHALRHYAAAARLEPDEPRWPLARAELLAQGGELEAARAALREASALTSPVHGPRVAALALAAGDFPRVDSLLADADRHDPSALWPRILRAQLALWSGALADARALADAIAAADADHPAADRLRGAVAVLEGRLEEAHAPLERAAARAPDEPETAIWRAELALREGDFEEAHALLNHAVARADGFLFVAWILRALIVIEETRADPRPLGHNVLEEIRDVLLELLPDAQEVIDAGEPAPLRELLEAALRRLGGNRTTTATTVDERGALHRLRTRTGARYSSRMALKTLLSLGPTGARERLDAVCRHFPRSALAVCHRAELHLWMGDLPRARADFERSIEMVRGTRFSYIGLTGVDILEGDPARALATSARGVEVMRGTEGPAVYVYRGEALRLLGRHDDARRDLTRAVHIHPTRIGAWINLGLLAAARGDATELRRVFAQVSARAHGLLSDAARERGVCIWPGVQAPAPSDDALRSVLERALAMMRGNRSSSTHTYFTREGALRFTDSSPPCAAETITRDLSQARAILLRSIGVTRAPRRGPPLVEPYPVSRDALRWRPRLEEPA